MKKRSRELKPKPETLILDAVAPGPALIKHLASCSAPVRSKALRLLEGWLLTQSGISDDDMKKFWKGLFYCLWHSDKAPAQAHLIARASSLVLNLDLSLALHYFSVFLITLKREWNGIDRLRLDKFYLLVRKFTRAVFDLCKKYSWNLELLGRIVDTFINNAFLAEDKLMGNGVCYHIASVWLDELNGCCVPVEQEVVGLLFKPYFETMGKCEDRVMVGKVKTCVFDELLNMGKSLLERKRKGVEGKDSYAEVALGLIAMKMGFSKMLFEVGSSVECVQGNRKVLFKLHEEFLRLEKEFETAGVDIVLPEVAVEDEEMIPELVPIENGKTEEDAAESSEDVQGDEGYSDETLRKCKKAKTMHDGSNKKGKKKQKKKGVSQDDSVIEENENCVPNGKSSNDENSKRGKKKNKSDISENGSAVENIQKAEVENLICGDGNSSNAVPDSESKLTFNESVISNLQMQFEKVAAEVYSGNDDDDDDYAPVISMKKKRKRAKSANSIESCIPDINDAAGDSAVSGTKSADKSSKKVRFAMKNNLVWKPHSPMPPQSLRLPPSVTPRGSALKKGVPPGPVREMPPATKRMKQKKKGRKILRTISPAVKRVKKLKASSA